MSTWEKLQIFGKRRWLGICKLINELGFIWNAHPTANEKQAT